MLFPLSLRSAQPRDFEQIKELIAVKFSSIPHIKTHELAERMDNLNRDSPMIFDVRSEEEYAVSHLHGAVRVDSKDILSFVGTEKNRPMVFYCAVGYRSSAVVLRLKKLGFTRVFNLEGSIFQWGKEQRKLFRGDQQVQEIHPYGKKWEKLMQ